MKNAFLVLLLVVATVSVTLLVVRDDTGDNTIADSSAETSQTDNQITSQAAQPSSGKALDYSNRGLRDFPEEIFAMTDATSLDISGNALDGALPGEIRFLTNLEVLDVSNNNMTGIPAEIGDLSQLRVINYSNNDITGLPNQIGNLSNLEIFDLSGNNPSQQDLDGLRKSLPSSVQFIL